MSEVRLWSTFRLPEWPNDPENLLLYWPIVPEKRHFHQESVGAGAAAERPGTRKEGSQHQGVRFLRHFPHGRPGAGCGRCRWRGGDRRLLKDVPILAPSARREPLRVQPGQSEAGNGLGPAPTSWKRPGRTGSGHRLAPPFQRQHPAPAGTFLTGSQWQSAGRAQGTRPGP